MTVPGVIAAAPGADWTIIAPDAGRIAELPKAEGDAVKTGDLLVRFEVPAIANEIAARKADVTQAGARLEAAKAAAAPVICTTVIGSLRISQPK